LLLDKKFTWPDFGRVHNVDIPPSLTPLEEERQGKEMRDGRRRSRNGRDRGGGRAGRGRRGEGNRGEISPPWSFLKVGASEMTGASKSHYNYRRDDWPQDVLR